MRRGLVAHGFDVTEVGTAAEALAELDLGAAFDAILVDPGQPERAEHDLCVQIRARTPTPLIVLSRTHSTRDRIRVLISGADDCLAKPFDLTEVVARIHAIERRSRWARDSGDGPGPRRDPYLRALGPVVLDTRNRTCEVAGTPVGLTGIEFNLLAFLMSHEGDVVPSTTLAIGLWPRAEPGSDLRHRLAVHVAALRRKLGAHGDMIRTGRGLGYSIEAVAGDSGGAIEAGGAIGAAADDASPRFELADSSV